MMGSFMQNPDNEFYKLDALDKRLFFEILENHERALDSWIEHTAADYTKKGIPMDSLKFKIEVKSFMEFVKKEDPPELNNSLEN